MHKVGFIYPADPSVKDRGMGIVQNKISPLCTIYQDESMLTAIDDDVKYKIGHLHEPPIIQGTDLYEWAKNNQEHFTAFLSTGWPEWVIPGKTLPVGISPHTWIKNKMIYPKDKSISAIFSFKTNDYAFQRSEFSKQNINLLGYNLRHKISTEFQDKIDVFGSMPSSKYKLSDTPSAKEEGLIPYRYHIVVENQWGYGGSEKLNDPIACGSVPIFWGDNSSPILNYYNKEGIILFKTLEDLEQIINSVVSEKDYLNRMSAIQENFNKLCSLN